MHIDGRQNPNDLLTYSHFLFVCILYELFGTKNVVTKCIPYEFKHSNDIWYKSTCGEAFENIISYSRATSRTHSTPYLLSCNIILSYGLGHNY